MSGTSVDLTVGGMTCAGCAARVEKRLNRVEGVDASVNFATHLATVHYDPARVTPDALIATVESTGYTAAVAAEDPGGADEDDELSALRSRLAVCIASTLPVLLLAMVRPLQFDGWQWVSLVLATPVVTWGAWPFHRAAMSNARHGATTMDTLISVGILAANGWSLYALLLGDAGDPSMRMDFSLIPARGDGVADVYLEVASGLATILLVGRYFEARARRNSGAAVRALLELGAKEASLLRVDGTEERVPVERIAVGDQFVVRPGEKVATDGVVEEGSGAIDTSSMTGESLPVEIGAGDEVAGATVNVGGRLVVRATRVGADTQLAQIGRLVKEAQSGKAAVQRLADRVSAVFVPVVMSLALLTFAAWIVLDGSGEAAFEAAVAVLIIACPCALGLATPTALLVGTGRGAQLGIVIRGPEVLESTRRVDTIVLDKTGTVTTGRLTVIDVRAAAGESRENVLQLAAAVENASEHPIAGAIVAAAGGVRATPAVVDFATAAGRGVTGVVDGKTVVVGGRRLVVDELGLTDDDALREAADEAQRNGTTVVWVGWDARVRGIISVRDVVKRTSAEAIRTLRELGLRPALLTGDHAAVARDVARQVGIDEADVVAEVLPAGKAAVIRALQRDGRIVAMAGDGINDAAALATADLGLAIGTGTDAAIQAGDLTLVSGDLRAAADAIRLARATLSTIKVNLFWAFAYNVAAIPLAAAGLLNPLIAGGAMAVSSLFVVGNSLRLRGFESVRTASTDASR